MNKTYEKKETTKLQAFISRDIDDWIREEARKLGKINKIGKIDRLGEFIDQLIRELQQYRAQKKK